MTITIYNNNHFFFSTLVAHCSFINTFIFCLSWSLHVSVSFPPKHGSLYLQGLWPCVHSTATRLCSPSPTQTEAGCTRELSSQRSSDGSPTFSGTAACSPGCHGSHGGFGCSSSRCGQHCLGVGPQTGLVSLNCSSFTLMLHLYLSLTGSNWLVCFQENSNLWNHKPCSHGVYPLNWS